ncbi:MAG: hypothetical protein ABJI69_00945 [Balneola sp.]
MAVKSGTSHAISTFLLTMISGILVYQYHELFYYSMDRFPLINFVHKSALKIQYLFTISGYDIDSGVIETVFVASILSFFWGVVYHYSRKF